MSLHDKVHECKVNSTFDAVRCMSVNSVLHKVSHAMVKVEHRTKWNC